MIPSVTITLANGQIGASIGTDDRVTGIVIVGAGTGTLALLAPVLLVSLDDAIEKGITQDVEPEAYRFCKEFYSVEGSLGVPLYLMLVANTASMGDLCDKDNASGIKKLVDFAEGRIRVLGILRKPAAGYEAETEQFIDSDVIDALPNAKAFVADRFARHTPLRLVLSAHIYDETSQVIFVPKTQNNNAVSLAIGSSVSGGTVSLGLILGRVAVTDPHRNIGRVRDGALPVQTMYIGTKEVKNFPGLSALIDAGYITFTNYPQKAGYFISDDPMCSQDDYKSLTNCRVIDKASIIAYQTYVEYLKDDVDIDQNGRIASEDIADLSAQVKNNIELAMSDNISGEAMVYIDPAQNLLSVERLKVKIRLTPKGYLKQIDIDLGFYNPALAANS